MKIENIKIGPMGFSFDPEFHIEFDIPIKHNYKFPLKFNGYLLLDKFRFAFLHEYEFSNNSEEQFNAKRSSGNYERVFNKTFVAPFSRLALSKLDEKRQKDPKGDLIFQLILNATFLEPQFDDENITVGQKSYRVATFDYQGALFKIQSIDLFNGILRIPSADWLHDFCPVFENNNYQIFEIPIPNISRKKNDIGIRVNEAIKSLQEMHKSKLEGEWNEVIKDSRPVWELIRNKQEIKDFLKDGGMNEETIISFNLLIDNFFDFASKFIHKESRNKKIMKTNNASKEDAELIYSMAFSIVNLIAKKNKR